MDSIRYGLIGVGMMGREHIANLTVIPGSSIVAIADPDPESRQRALELLPRTPAIFEDADRLIERAECDALVIATPNDTHAGLLQRLFSARRAVPVLVEKPICTDPADLERIRQAAIGYGAPVWVGMEYRYMPPVAEMVKAVHAGRLGRPAMIAIREHRYPFLTKVGNWNRFAERTGGTLVEKCCHFFDLMRLIARSEPVRIYASGSAAFNHRDERYDGRVPDILDNAFAVVDFENGIRASLDLCMFAEGSWWQEVFTVTGEAAKIECYVPAWQGYAETVPAEVIFSPRAERKCPQRRLVDVDPQALSAGAHHGSTYYQHLAFRRAVLGEGPVEVTLEDGLRAVAMGMAAELSVRERRAVEIDGLSFG